MTFSGAENGTRTRDLNLGKVALYQLSYFRKTDYQRIRGANRIYPELTDRRRNHTDTAWVSIWVSASDIDCDE